ncbi:uncharacterized protein DSM5745_10133 [Aspergillus mulundensis]|uniref:Uncharacterized protein n=1 Tax=Aspergillus mulundensis TaxID=1810919 RepID=A0A3D8QMK1_9EURO|nr:hypothetical protein DSM5745_10133 [Aspergillus mulundensis]RDW63022.1 hypothetical protein DSM5745_10133 [Aspergillus mulundensis]
MTVMESEYSPSPTQIALALAVVKLKPAGLDIKEFILQCRESIKASKNAEIFHAPEKFFDSVSFWKRAYEKSEAEKSTLLDRIFELEQRNEELVEKIHTRDDVPVETIPAAAVPVQGPLKRTATTNQASRKRLKTLSFPMGPLFGTDSSSLHDDMTGESDREPTTAFLRQSYVLQKALQKRRDTTGVVRAAVALCKTCEDQLAEAITQETAEGRTTNGPLTEFQVSHLSLVLRGTESSVRFLFQTIKKLCGTGASHRKTGLLIYHVVCLYAAIMDCLQRYCNTRAAPSRPESQEFSMQTRSMTRMQTKSSDEPGSQSKVEDEAATQLTLLLNRMVISLDLACPGHRQLLEGFLYTLLSRAGSVLCLFVFQDLQLRPDLQADPDQLPLPAGLRDAKVDDRSLGGAQVEARYLVCLVRGALAVLDKPPSLSSAASEDQFGGQFLSTIRARLQSTLVQAVFGANSDFGQTLQQPVEPKGLDIRRVLEDHQPSELSVPEWYTQQLWQLLGWELLSKIDLS